MFLKVMDYTVTVTRKGRTTTRRVYAKITIETGALLKAATVDGGILLKPTPSTVDSAGSRAIWICHFKRNEEET